MAASNPLPVRLVTSLTCGDSLVPIAHHVRTQTALRYQAGNGRRSLARSRSSSSALRP